MISKTASSGIAAAVFDMDGTLLDTERLYREAIFDACRELGYEMTTELHAAQIGVPVDGSAKLYTDAFGPEFPFDLYHNRMRERMVEIEDERGVALKKGARPLLELLRARGIPTAIVTSTGRQPATNRLTRAGIIDLLTLVITRTDTEKGKPHPEPFLTAAERLGVAPKACLAVEDSPNGVRAAHSAHMQVVMVPDLVPPTPEIAALTTVVLPDLDAVRERFFAVEPA